MLFRSSPPHALPLDQPHFSPFVVTNNGGIDWFSRFYFSRFLGFIFLVFWVSFFWFLGFIFLGFILWVDWVGLNVMVVGLCCFSPESLWDFLNFFSGEVR